MSYQIKPLFHEILQVLRKAKVPFDPLLPTHVKTVTTVNRSAAGHEAFIGMAILPGRINTLLRPKTFLVETLRLEERVFVRTFNVVVMDAAGDLRLVEEITTDDAKPGWASRIVDQVGDLVDEQATLNHNPPTLTVVTRSVLSDAALRIAHTAKPRWASWVIYILEVLQDHAEPRGYDIMLTALSLAIEIRQLEGSW